MKTPIRRRREKPTDSKVERANGFWGKFYQGYFETGLPIR